MRTLLDRLANPLHQLIALACTWLIVSSPWLGMVRWLPDAPGVINLSHVIIGLAVLPLAVLYALACWCGGRWRQYYPWGAGRVGAIGRELGGLLRGQRPVSEGGGLLAAVEGLALLALLASASTGAVWFGVQDTEAALFWHDAHVIAARCLVGLLALHLAAVALHFAEFVRG